ncbi:MAG: hypothetical protein E7600_07315 [Ruminococcaceae bacterium]|nr:hypothetical protein [Oscillospiraceae bacterium]
MKKFLSYALVAMMIVATVAVSASAVEFVKGDGYDTWSGASYSDSTNAGKSPVSMNVNEDGSVTVEQGGYYKEFKSDNNFGGVATKDMVGLDGLEVTVNFEEVPSPTNDCWFGVLLVQNPYPFNTGDMAPTGGYNPLIRFNTNYVEFYSPTFTGLGNSTSTDPAAPDGMFGLQSGDTLTMSVKYELGQYMVTYKHNDMVYEVPADKTIDASNLFLDTLGGKAHVVVTGTLLGDLNTWKYTVSVKEGEGISEEELANRAFELSKNEVKTSIETYLSDIDTCLADGIMAAGGVADDNVAAALSTIAQAKVDMEEIAAELVDAADQEALDLLNTDAIAVRGAATAAVDEIVNVYAEGVEPLTEVPEGAVEAITPSGETTRPSKQVKEEEATKKPSNTNGPVNVPEPVVTEEEDAKAGFPVWAIILIVVAVVVVVVVVVVLGKKKKNQ